MNNLSLFLILVFTLSKSLVFCREINTKSALDLAIENVCIDLSSYENIESLSSKETKQIFAASLHKTSFISEIWAKDTTYKHIHSLYYIDLVTHRLQQECPTYRLIDSKIYNYLSDDDARDQYLAVRKFIIALESTSDTTILNTFLDPLLHNEEGKLKLDSLITEINIYKKTSALFIMKQYTKLFFYVNFHDLENENIGIQILFNDTKDNLIDGWEFDTKEEIKIQKEKIENEKYNFEFPLTPPPPPPPK